jgi:hypothetical protein
MSDKSKRGKLARASGARFELKVRSDLESQGWIMDKWTNNVDLQIGKMVNRHGISRFYRLQKYRKKKI